MGDGEMREALEKLVGRLGMEDRVRFLGHVPYERMPSLYRRYDVLVLPARWEVFGFVVVEALMSSTAAIVSSEVGAKDFLPREAIFPVGDIPSLSDRLRAFRDPDLRNRVVRYAQRRVEELATPERWASTFATLLEE
jgi:glycosyltransferase involved in cell wall biosynthesis